jgi:arylsulfatase A-like enzyme
MRALWFGLIAGTLEGIVPLTQKFGFGRMRIHTSPHILWMAPLAEAVVFLLVGLVLALVARMAMRRSPDSGLALATGVLAALAGWALTLLYPQLYEWAAVVLALGAGVQAARASRSGGLDRLVRPTLVPVGVLVALTTVAMVAIPRWRESRGLATLTAAREGAPNVLLLILDTVRAQSLGLYGAANPTTPRLSALAAEGTVFDYALSTAPWTIPSHASMFTGRYPHELTADWLTPLDDSTPTLAEALTRAGYATGGFVANYLTSWEIGFSRGFARYQDYRLDAGQLALSSAVLRRLAYVPRLRRLVGRYDAVNRKRAPAISAEFLRWMDGRGEAPFFAFLNYMDAHEMYNPPAPFRGAFGPDTARKNWLTRYGLGGLGYRSAKARMTPSEVAAELNAYEESIAYLDHHVGALMDSLAARGVLDNTVVIVTADHGEHFGEHGRWEHASSLYPQLLHVPLVMRGPGVVPAGRRIPDLVTLRDLAATVLAIGPGSEELPGRSLARYWDPSGKAVDRPESPILSSITNGFWTESSKPDVRRGMRSIVADGGMLVIEDVKTPTAVEYFQLPRDPRGERDLSSDSVRAAYQGSLQQLQAVTWRSQSQGVARQAGTIGAPPQP